jgi:2-keto-3-deoxy-L-rhamnonate aldolase RhmA
MDPAIPTRRIGILTAEPERLLLGIAAQTGLDFIVLDAEQTQLDPRRCGEVVRALAGSRTEVVVRVPDLAERTLVTYANTGVSELLLPQLRSLDELRAASRATRYPPDGSRSRQVSPASRYGTDFTTAPRLSVLIETAEALGCVGDLADSGLLDSAWFGPTDLVDDLTRIDPSRASRMDELIDDAIELLRVKGIPVGLPGKDLSSAHRAFARGADLCSVYWEKWLLDLFGDIRSVATHRAFADELATP